MKKTILLILALSIVSSMPIFAKTKHNKISGIYSSLFYHEEAGDLLGVEAFIIFTKKGYYIVFQQSEGTPEVPTIVPMNVVKQNITFTLPDTIIGYTGTFTGEIKNGYLIGDFTVNGEKKNIKLKRKNSYWQ